MKIDLSQLSPDQKKDLDIAFIVRRMGLSAWLDSLTDEQFDKLYNYVEPVWDLAKQHRGYLVHQKE